MPEMEPADGAHLEANGADLSADPSPQTSPNKTSTYKQAAEKIRQEREGLNQDVNQNNAF